MQSKIMNVFYGTDILPYKDAERTIHFPIVGNAFNGSNNVNTIRFYVDRIGGATNVTWVVVSKLPNGQIANEVLDSNNAILDSELNEHYIEFSISSYYTTLKGDLYLSLNGYQGGVEVEQDEDTGIYSIYGTPTIQATGSIKIGINYAPQIIQGSHFNTSDLQQILGALSGKSNISDVILVVDDVNSIDLSDYEEGQYFYDKTTNKFYILDDQSNLTVYNFINIENGSNEKPGTLKMLTESETWNGIDNTGATQEYTTGAFGKYSFQTGGKSCAMGERSIAGGTKTYAGKGALAIGDTTHAEDFAMSMGYKTVAKGNYSHAEGYITMASGSSSHAEGTETIAGGDYSHAEGGKCETKSGFIVVNHGSSPTPTPTPEGNPTLAEQDATNGIGTHAEGMNTLAFAIASHSSGVWTKAYTRYSHAEGYQTQTGELVLRKTEDNKDYYSVDHSKYAQHAEGIETLATGHGSHAGGIGNIADKDYSTAIGKYAIATNTSGALFSVGNGTGTNARNDAFEVLANGTAKIGAMGNDNLSIVTKKYVDDLIASVKANTFQVVDSLPAIGQEGIIYLIETSSGVYEQYIWEGSDYIDLGTTQIDLSDYYTKTQADNKFVAKTTTIAGVDLQDNITSQELTDALVFMNDTSDLDYVMGE